MKQQPLPSALDLATYEKWRVAPWRGDPGGNNWGCGEFWWYGQAKVFALNAEIEYRADDATALIVKGKAQPGRAGALFGIAIAWPQPLIGPHMSSGCSGYAYDFLIRFASAAVLPDMVTVNDAVVWRKGNGDSPAEEVKFSYIPAAPLEPAHIRLIKSAGDNWSVIRPGWRSRAANLTCERRSLPADAVPPAYERYALPANVRTIGPDPTVTLSLKHWELLPRIAYERPTLPKPPYPTAQAVILERSPEYAINSATNYLLLAGFSADRDFVTYQPKGDEFRSFAAKCAAAGVRNLLITPLFRLGDGRYQFYHFRVEDAGEHIEAMAEVIKSWLQMVPDGQVYAFPPEINSSFGVYKGGIGDSRIQSVAGYEAVAEGGAVAWQAAFAFYQSVWRELREKLGEAGKRLKVIAQFDRAAFQGAYGFHLGADIVIHKNIHRQSINIVVANSRGAASAYGKEYGYDFDAWDRNYFYSYAPDEIRQGLMVYFHAGARYLMDEIPGWMHPRRAFGTADEGVNPWGAAWLDFLRYVRVHPRRGEQKVRIGIMRALGDEWNAVASPSASWEANPWLPRAEMYEALQAPVVPAKWAKAARAAASGMAPSMEDTYLWDYVLLNLVFANYGLPYRTFTDRLATGTPYGPVDFIPWDIPPERLNEYALVIFLGQGYVTEQTIRNLEQYVVHGGTLVLAAGQLRGAHGELLVDAFLGTQLAGARTCNGMPYTQLVLPATGAEVVCRLPNSDPLVVKTEVGAGRAFLFSTEWLTERGEQAAIQAIQPLLEAVKWLRLSPASDWIEYMVRRKGPTWIFPIFNHGRGFFPSGNGYDHGAWRGCVRLDLNELGLAGQPVSVYRAVYDSEALIPIRLVAIEAEVKGEWLAFDLEVNAFEEVAIGPAASAERDFYR